MSVPLGLFLGFLSVPIGAIADRADTGHAWSKALLTLLRTRLRSERSDFMALVRSYATRLGGQRPRHVIPRPDSDPDDLLSLSGQRILCSRPLWPATSRVADGWHGQSDHPTLVQTALEVVDRPVASIHTGG